MFGLIVYSCKSNFPATGISMVAVNITGDRAANLDL
jgi:hypothetical protein